MTPLIMPSVHANGTSKEELVRQHLDIMEAATALLKALQEGAPNARDYYPQGPDATVTEAALAWNQRYQAVERLRADIEMQAMKITLEGL